MPFSEKIAKIYLNRRGSSSLRSSAGSKKKVQKSQKSKIQKSKSPTREISNLSEIRKDENNLEISKEMSEISIERVAEILVCNKKFKICMIFKLTLFYLYISWSESENQMQDSQRSSYKTQNSSKNASENTVSGTMPQLRI